MNELTRQITSQLEPCAALIAYQGNDENRNRYFLELRPIEDGKMGTAIPVTYEFINELASSFTEIQIGTPYGIIPDNLIYSDTRKGKEQYVWYNPPGKHMMYFRKELGIENTEYFLPGIIYEVKNNSLNVYAFKGKRPTEKTELFEAPFFNVTREKVCLGFAELEKLSNPTHSQLLEYWEKKFWLTEFSHLGGHGNPTKSNLVLVTKAAHNTTFNLEELQPLNIKLKNLINK